MARYGGDFGSRWSGAPQRRRAGYFGGLFAPWPAGYPTPGPGYPGDAHPYGAGYGGFGGDPYDRAFKSRWQTDHGDPYRDRARRTPMRAVREPYDADPRWDPRPGAPHYGGSGMHPYRERYDTGWRW